MANTYRKVYIHIVFAVKNRDALLHKKWRSQVFAYISGILNEKDQYSLAVNGSFDHIHILFDYNLKVLIPDLVRDIKIASSNFIKEEKLSPFKFDWQIGYGAFSVGWKEKSQMISYIINQEKHHKKRTFKDEYMSLLNKYEIDFKDEYVFEFMEGIED